MSFNNVTVIRSYRRILDVYDSENLQPLPEHGLNAGVAVPEQTQTKVHLKKRISVLSITNKEKN